MNGIKRPEFSLTLLHPRYWLTWLGMGVAALVAQLPSRIQIELRTLSGMLAYQFAHKRRHIAATNIALCYPERSDLERKLGRGRLGTAPTAATAIQRHSRSDSSAKLPSQYQIMPSTLA